VSEQTGEARGRTVAVFVYGTLKPGGFYYPRIANWVVYTTDAMVRGELFDTGLGYPAAVFGEADVVHGTMLHFAESTIDRVLQIMDEIESEGEEYRRVRVLAVDGTEAISYEWIGDTSRMRPLSGPWEAR
jgi:gamma-glutamylcyclotransferase (GGCT)/AIG2-like uncharacterized protein YtfP